MANAKALDVRFDWWTTSEGLPQNTVNAVVQTQDGYLWIATFGGLARFDGLKFTVFDTANTPELKSQRITALHESREGILWIGTETGEISCRQNGKFHSFDDGELEEIDSLYSDSYGYLWAGGTKGARRYMLPETACSEGDHRFERIKLEVDGQFHGRISSIRETDDGDIWLSNLVTGKGNLSRVIRWRENAPVEVFDPLKGVEPGTFNKNQEIYISDIAVIDKTLWVAMDIGLFSFDGTRFKKELTFNKNNSNKAKFTRDIQGNLLLNTSDGIARLGKDGRWEKSPADLSDKGGLYFLSDREGNLWLGTNTLGLGRLKQDFIESFDKSKGVDRDQTGGVLEDSEGNLWFGGFGLHRFENGRIVTENIAFKSYVISLAETRSKTLWAGGYDILVARHADGSVTDLSSDIKKALGVPQFAVKAIFEDSRGNLWLGFREQGVLRRDADGNYQHLTHENGLANDEVQFITETKDGALWLGTLGGASRFDGSKFTNLSTSDGFANNNIRDIRETPDGSIYFGTYGGGLSRLKNGVIRTITTQNGLFDNIVSRILVDEKDNFWMLGNLGVFSVNRTNLDAFFDGTASQIVCRSFGIEDGMLSAEGNGGSQPSGWLASDKRLWFPTIRGYVAITPPPPERSLPNVVIEEVKVNNKEIELQNLIEIQSTEQNLEIVYTGLSFNHPDQLRFRYKLEGYDKDWTEAGTRRAAYYPYPPAGEYVFTVQAANADGVWNENSAKLQVRILPKFYQTWGFIVLCGLIAAALVYLIFSIRIARLNRAKRAQELLSRRLIQAQEEERKRIAGDLHDSLSQNLVIIKNRAMISLSERDDVEKMSGQIEEIAEAADESLIELREIAANLRPFQIDRLGFSKAVEALVRKTNTQGLKVEGNIERIDGLLKPEMVINLYRILQEVLNNIVRHSGATLASVEIKTDDKKIEVVITDNGKGFDLQQLYGRQADNGSGFGLMGINERARILGCVPVIETGPEKGTAIRLSFRV